MILLESGHHMLREALELRLGEDKAEFRERNPVEGMIIADFDDVSYCIKAKDELFTLFFVMHGYESLADFGVEAYLTKTYADCGVNFDFSAQTAEGKTYNFSMTFDLSSVPAVGAEVFTEKISAIKRNVLAAPFFWYFDKIREGATPEKAVQIPFRKDESIYLKKGKEDSMVVVFGVTFSDKNDWVVAEVFLREFADARREPALQTAPAVSFSKSPPGELDGLKVDDSDSVVYISFALFQRHYDGAKADASVSSLCLFRNYLHYHIKCSKAFMHMRMRKRVDDLLQVLNRAKPPAEGAVEKKTWTGRSMN
mmetsp:Transcript_45438/g.106767  ORF Transcript_45438/g.106767 Transcript_45438/m.106767 type:complete len:310 (-) Transcript_45438:69-998(-)